MKLVIGIGCFVAGAGVGSCITYKCVKKKCEEKAEAEIEAYKASIGRKLNPVSDSDILEDERKPAESPKITNDILKAQSIILEHDYSKCFDNNEKPAKAADCEVITEEEFGDNEGYDTVTLTRYSNGYVTDESDDPILNVKEILGFELTDDNGGEEMFIRNHDKQIDYEIVFVDVEYILEE